MQSDNTLIDMPLDDIEEYLGSKHNYSMKVSDGELVEYLE